MRTKNVEYDRSQSGWRALAVVLALALCLGCSALPVAAQAWLAQANTPSEFATPMCVFARRGQVGLWWNVNVPPARAFAVAPRYNALCVVAPWSPVLPARGRPALDVAP